MLVQEWTWKKNQLLVLNMLCGNSFLECRNATPSFCPYSIDILTLYKSRQRECCVGVFHIFIAHKFLEYLFLFLASAPNNINTLRLNVVKNKIKPFLCCYIWIFMFDISVVRFSFAILRLYDSLYQKLYLGTAVVKKLNAFSRLALIAL